VNQPYIVDEEKAAGFVKSACRAECATKGTGSLCQQAKVDPSGFLLQPRLQVGSILGKMDNRFTSAKLGNEKVYFVFETRVQAQFIKPSRQLFQRGA